MDACDSIPSILVHDPFRTLDWRWQRARHRIARRQPPRRDDDPVTRLARTYLRRGARDGRHSTAKPRESWAAIEAACALAARADRRRSEVEARILAGQDDQEIGRRCDLEPEAVGLFEALFFHVRDRLGATDWIVARALGPGIRTGFGDLGAAWKAVGYFGGAAMLEAMIAATDGIAVGNGGSISEAMTPVDPASEGARLLATALLLPAGTSPEALAGLHARLRPAEATLLVPGTSPADLTGLLDDLTWDHSGESLGGRRRPWWPGPTDGDPVRCQCDPVGETCEE